jgi:hypothetical protein
MNAVDSKDELINVLKECAEKSDTIEPVVINEHTLIEHNGDRGGIFIFAGIFNYLSESTAAAFCKWITENEPRIELASLVFWSDENRNVERSCDHAIKWGL